MNAALQNEDAADFWSENGGNFCWEVGRGRVKKFVREHGGIGQVPVGERPAQVCPWPVPARTDGEPRGADAVP